MERILLRELVRLGENTWGIIQHPYVTYRRLSKASLIQVFYIFVLVGLYFFFISPIRLHTLHPLLLTMNAWRLFTVALVGYFLIVGFFSLCSKLWRTQVPVLVIGAAWAYSLIPTLIWFFTTSIFYIVLPPPRNFTLPGEAFSLLFMSFSVFLFLWKGLLYYLTLRLVVKLDLVKIVGVTVVFLPLVMVYTGIMYKIGIFRVPFI